MAVQNNTDRTPDTAQRLPPPAVGNMPSKEAPMFIPATLRTGTEKTASRPALKKSAELLLEQKYNVSEVCYMVGFSDPYYFSKCFKQQFGVPPSCYAGQERAGEPEEAETKE